MVKDACVGEYYANMILKKNHPFFKYCLSTWENCLYRMAPWKLCVLSKLPSTFALNVKCF